MDKLESKTQAELETAINALLSKSFSLWTSGRKAEAVRLERLIIPLVWAANLLAPKDDPSLAAFDSEINAAIAKHDQEMAAFYGR